MTARPISVVIVDDDVSVRCGLQRFSEAAGLNATVYGSGCEFIAALDRGDPCPDCLLIDAHMPEMDGLELHKHLIGRGVRMPTIVFTADDTPEMCAQFMTVGTVWYLHKPLPCHELLRVIQQAVGCSGEQ